MYMGTHVHVYMGRVHGDGVNLVA